MADDSAQYPPLSPRQTGLKGLCPRCGRGALFEGFLTIRDACPSCGLDYSFSDTGDGPAFFISSIGMVPVAAFAVWMEVSVGAPYWLNALLTLPLLVLLCILPLRPLKGLFAALTYVNSAHEGRLVQRDKD